MKERIGKFEILRCLGQGAMGEVFLARDPVIGREVAVKTLHPAWAETPQARERFFHEAQAAGRLSHPNIVSVLEFGEDQGELYLVMEYVPGQDLASALHERILSPAVVLDLLAQVCDGLAVAHRNGILHRDIKPSNIRLLAEPGQLRAKILDFGIARARDSELTGSNELLGTFSYMAPEYIRTGRATPQTDLFAVGVILYEALAGRKPFQSESTPTLIYKIINETPRIPPAAHLRGISPATAKLLDRVLAKDPAQRFDSAEAMAACLRGAQDPAWPGPPPPEQTVVVVRPALPRKRKRYAWLLAALVPLMVAGLLAGRAGRKAAQEPEAAPAAPVQNPPPAIVPGRPPKSLPPAARPSGPCRRRPRPWTTTRRQPWPGLMGTPRPANSKYGLWPCG